jgi:hypothetical protein
MPGKTAKSAPLPPFGLSGMTALVRAATLSCENAGKSQKCTQDRESSGESRLNPHSPDDALISATVAAIQI